MILSIILYKLSIITTNVWRLMTVISSLNIRLMIVQTQQRDAGEGAIQCGGIRLFCTCDLIMFGLVIVQGPVT